MADPIRLFSEFKDDRGVDWRVNIHDEDFTGTATEFTLGADGFVLRYTGDNENRYQPVIGSELTFTLVEQGATETTFMDLLSTAAEQRFSVSVRKDPDEFNTLWWGGVILPEQVIRPDEYFPIMNTLTASDDVGNLEELDYNNDGTAYSGQASVLYHMANCLMKTRATHLWGTDAFIYYINDFKSIDYVGSNQLKDTRIAHSSFYNPDDDGVKQYFKTFEVLENLSRVFNARIFQSEGKWWFVPVGAQFNSTDLVVEGIQKDLTDLSQNDVAADVPFSSSFVKMNGYEFSNLTPTKEVKRARRYDGNMPVIIENILTKAEFGTQLDDTNIDYDATNQLLISGVFNYEYDGDGATTGDARVGRVELQFELKCGNQYLKRNAAYAGTVNEFQLVPGELLQYTGNSYGAASWETSAEKWHEVSPVFDTNGGGDFTIPIYILTPPLPSDQDGLELTVSIRGVNYQGSTDTNLTNTSGALYSITLLRVDLTGDPALGDQQTFTAVNSDNCRHIIDQGPAILGDQDTVNSIGVVRVISGSNAIPSSGWQSLSYTGTGLGINRLGVQEVLSGQRKATRIQRGEVFGNPISMYQIIDDTDGTYALFELTYTARPCINEVEAFKLIRDTSTTSIVADPPIDISVPIAHQFYGATGGVYEAFNRTLGLHVTNYGSRQVTRVLDILNRDELVTTIAQVEYMIFNSWTGSNGDSTIYLPTVTGNEGRTMQFHSDSTITANTFVRLFPFATDTGVTIDGAASYDFNRAYDGITILCHGGQWYIIQKKDK
jgi:hypothetical protein